MRRLVTSSQTPISTQVSSVWSTGFRLASQISL